MEVLNGKMFTPTFNPSLYHLSKTESEGRHTDKAATIRRSVVGFTGTLKKKGQKVPKQKDDRNLGFLTGTFQNFYG